jgi:hypothetical protein
MNELEFAGWLHKYGYLVGKRYHLLTRSYQCPVSRTPLQCPCDRVHAMIESKGMCDGGIVYSGKRRY